MGSPQLVVAQITDQRVPTNTPFAAPVTSELAPSLSTFYRGAFFAPFAMATALNIVRLVPGSSTQQTDSEVRGFKATAGKVVFNGAGTSSKSEYLETILARISASRVLWVESGRPVRLVLCRQGAGARGGSRNSTSMPRWNRSC